MIAVARPGWPEFHEHAALSLSLPVLRQRRLLRCLSETGEARLAALCERLEALDPVGGLAGDADGERFEVQHLVEGGGERLVDRTAGEVHNDAGAARQL